MIEIESELNELIRKQERFQKPKAEIKHLQEIIHSLKNKPRKTTATQTKLVENFSVGIKADFTKDAMTTITQIEMKVNSEGNQ